MAIDVAKIFQKKNPKLYNFTPKFMIKRLKKLVHQDEGNEIIQRNEHLRGIDFNNAMVDEFQIKTKVINEDNIPHKGRHIFVSNHPLGGLDGIAKMKLIQKHHPNIRFIANDILLNLENLDPLLVPVNKHGRQSKENARRIQEVFASDMQVLCFPAGACSRKIKGKIVDLEWNKYFVKKAIESKRDIIPIYIDGKNSNWFYNLAKITKAMRLPKIEMLWLPDEMFKQKGKTLTFVIGESIKWEDIQRARKSDHEKIAQNIKEQTYLLATQVS